MYKFNNIKIEDLKMGLFLLFKKNTQKLLPRFESDPILTGIFDIGSTLYPLYTINGSNYETFQWKTANDINGSDSNNIDNTGNYNLLLEDINNKYISCEITAFNQKGSVVKSTPYYLIPSVPKVISGPVIVGSFILGQTLSVEYNIQNADVINIEWYSYDNDSYANPQLIGTSSNKVTTFNELGKKIDVIITSYNDYGTKTIRSALVGPIVQISYNPEVFSVNPTIAKDQFAAGINVGEYVKCSYGISGSTTADPYFNWYAANDASGNGEVLLGNIVKDSYFLGDSTQTKYISCEVIVPTTSGYASKKSNYIGPVGNILGTPITQAMVGNEGFYYITNTGTYYLAEDITVNNTAFCLNNEKITLNLNGHTLTYNNSPKVEIPNHSFEDGFNGWDLTNAPNATLGSGTPITNKVHDGGYSLKFTLPLENQYIVNEQEVTLQPNTRYSLSAMFYTHNSSGTLYVQLSGVNVPYLRTVTYSGTNYRGMQFKETIFDTSGTSETYKIKVGVTSPSGSSERSLYLDDIKVQKHRQHAVIITPLSWQSDRFPGVTKFSTKDPKNILIKNGNIIQGQDKGTWCHNIAAERGEVSGTVIDHVACEVYGANSSNICIDWGGATVSNSDFISRISAITSRDQNDGLMVGGNGSFEGRVYNNTFTDGPGVGVRASTRWGGSQVYNNTFRMKNRYTNGFCISANAVTGTGAPTLIYNNKIENTGVYSGRGIGMGDGNSDPKLFPRAKIYNNKIQVQGLATIPEYGGAMLGGVYAIQIEGGKGVLVSGNDITAYGTESSAWCVRHNSNVSPLLVVNNSLKGVRQGFIYSQHDAVKNVAGCIKPADASIVNINNNTMSTNTVWVGGINEAHNLQLSGNKLIIDGDYQKARWLETDWASKGSTGIRFIDNIYNDDLTRQTFESAKIEAGEIIKTSPDSSFKTSWSTQLRFLYNNITVDTVSAQIFDNSGILVYSGISDNAGKINTLLDQFQWVGSSLSGAGRRQYNDYTVIANFGGLSGLSGSRTFTVNNKQIIDIYMSGVDDILYTPIPPQQYIVPEYSLPTGGTTHYVTQGKNLQTIFNNMSGGDVVVLDADATWTGKYTIPRKDGNDWIYVISSRMNNLPGENTRVGLDDTGNMPTIYVGTGQGSSGPMPLHPILNISKGAKKVRFVGLNFSSKFTGTNNIEYGYIYLGHESSSGDSYATDIIFDRCVLNGTKTGNHKHGMAIYDISGAAIINCHFSEFHLSGGESYAIHCFDSKGPVLMENNYLEAAGINVFMGDNVNVFPRDITIRGNHIIKPLKWNKEHPSFEGKAWTSKNPLEIKCGSRFLIEGNRIENSWPSAQVGNGSLFTPRGNPVSDIDYQNNVLLNCVDAIVVNNADKTILRTRIQNNIIYNYPRYLPSMSGSTTYSFSVFSSWPGKNKYVTIKNNTIIPVRKISGYLVLPMDSSKRKALIGVKFENNIAQPGTYTLASMDGYGQAGPKNLIQDYSFKNNILVGSVDYTYKNLHYPETGNWTGWVWLANDGQVGYTNTGFTTLEDFRLLPSSPYSGYGADLDKILAVLRDPF